MWLFCYSASFSGGPSSLVKSSQVNFIYIACLKTTAVDPKCFPENTNNKAVTKAIVQTYCIVRQRKQENNKRKADIASSYIKSKSKKVGLQIGLKYF